MHASKMRLPLDISTLFELEFFHRTINYEISRIQEKMISSFEFFLMTPFIIKDRLFIHRKNCGNHVVNSSHAEK